MIADPVRVWNLETFQNLTKQNINKTIFFISPNGENLTLAFVDKVPFISQLTNQPANQTITCWSIGKNNYGQLFRIGYSTATSEEFLEFIKQNHKGHFEWLLFHPEWTR